MRFLGERLHAAGHTVSAVRLAGHATQVEELESCSWQDWYRSAEEGLVAVARRCSSVLVIGSSLGSLLALRLAHAHHGTVAALSLLGPPLVLRRPWPATAVSWSGPLLSWLPTRLRFVAKTGSDIADPQARRVHPGYRSMPLRSVAEFVALQGEVRTLLAAIKQPTLAIQARQDHTVDLQSLAVLQSEMPNLWGTVILPNSFHVVAVDLERERVAQEIIRFVGQVLEMPARMKGGRKKPAGAAAANKRG
jgi:carboxylesterase